MYSLHFFVTKKVSSSPSLLAKPRFYRSIARPVKGRQQKQGIEEEGRDKTESAALSITERNRLSLAFWWKQWKITNCTSFTPIQFLM